MWDKDLKEYQTSSTGDTRSLPATPSKSKMADRVYLYAFVHSHKLLLKMFFDMSTPSMKKVKDREVKTGKMGKK